MRELSYYKALQLAPPCPSCTPAQKPDAAMCNGLALCVCISVPTYSDDMRRLLSTLQQLQHATKILQVLEQLQQQQMGSPGRPGAASATSAANGTPLGGLSFAAAAGVGGGFGQQPLLRANNASVAAWRQQIAARRSSSSSNSHLFLDDLLQQLQQAAGLRDGSAALAYPYPDVLTAIDALFASSGSGGGSSSSGGDSSVWHAKLAVLLYYLLDGGWLLSAEPFAQVGNVLVASGRGTQSFVYVRCWFLVAVT